MLISKFNKSQDKCDIEGIKKLIDFSLPEQYLAFMRKYNGGETPKTKWNGKCRSDVRGFFGYGIDNKSWNLEENLEYPFVEDILAIKLFPFAQNSFGDYFCINGEDESIWFISHDSENKKQIADDFNSFIIGCKSQKIGHIRTIEERTQCVWENHGIKPSEDLMRAWQDEIDRFSRIHQEEVVVD